MIGTQLLRWYTQLLHFTHSYCIGAIGYMIGTQLLRWYT